MRLNLGSGGRRLKNYVNIDIRPQFKPDIVADVCALPFGENIADEIRLDATYEHIYPHKRKAALGQWRKILKPNGKLIMNWIPDFEAILKFYGGPGPCDEFPKMDVEMARRMCCGAAPEDTPSLHKDIFTIVKVRQELTDAGFIMLSIDNVAYCNERLPLNINVVAQP